MLNGAKYAASCLWWWFTEDEIKAKLLQGSPVKYTTRDVNALLGKHDEHAEPVAEEPMEYIPPPPRAEVVVSEPVKSGNDHLPAKQKGKKKAGSDHHDGKKAPHNGASKVIHEAVHDGRLPKASYRSEENSPRILAK